MAENELFIICLKDKYGHVSYGVHGMPKAQAESMCKTLGKKYPESTYWVTPLVAKVNDLTAEDILRMEG